MTKIAIIQFPGSNCDYDTIHALKNVIKIEADLIWHHHFDGSDFDAVILPGGFSYGDHLRGGIIAAHSPAMQQVKEMAKEGKPVLGICNGMQVLIESELLPGALTRNECLTFVCEWIHLVVNHANTPFTRNFQKDAIISLPVAHGEGNYYLDENGLKELHENDQIIFQYCTESGELTRDANPNGSKMNIAGICNLNRNVVGLMPHPERGSEAILSPVGSEHGKIVFESVISFLNQLK